MLQKKYQPQLRKGIKIAVDLVNSVKEDAKDGDVDVKVKIAPNTTIKVISIGFESGINEEEIEKHNKEFIEAVYLIVEEIYETWGHKNSKFEGKEAASNQVKNFFDLVINEISLYKSENMDGFKGIESIINGTGIKRKIKINRGTEFIGSVIANYEKVKEKVKDIIQKPDAFSDRVWRKIKEDKVKQNFVNAFNLGVVGTEGSEGIEGILKLKDQIMIKKGYTHKIKILKTDGKRRLYGKQVGGNWSFTYLRNDH